MNTLKAEMDGKLESLKTEMDGKLKIVESALKEANEEIQHLKGKKAHETARDAVDDKDTRDRIK